MDHFQLVYDTAIRLTNNMQALNAHEEIINNDLWLPDALEIFFAVGFLWAFHDGLKDNPPPLLVISST